MSNPTNSEFDSRAERLFDVFAEFAQEVFARANPGLALPRQEHSDIVVQMKELNQLLQRLLQELAANRAYQMDLAKPLVTVARNHGNPE